MPLSHAYILGALGAALIVIAWASVVRTPPPPPRLSLLYAAGSMLLTIYAAMQRDPIFTVLNAAAFALAVVNLLRAKRI